MRVVRSGGGSRLMKTPNGLRTLGLWKEKGY